MDIEIIPDVLDNSKVKRLPKNPWRGNMYRHITKRKRRKGAHTGIVQDVFKKRNRKQ